MLLTPTTTMLLCVGFLIFFGADLSFTKSSRMLIEPKDSDGIEKAFKRYLNGSAKQYSAGSFDYADLIKLPFGLEIAPSVITSFLPGASNSIQQSWDILKKLLRSYNFETIITKLHLQSMNGDLVKVVDAFDMNKILDAIDTEGMGKEIGEFAQKQLNKTRMTKILKEAHKIVQSFDEYNVTEGVYPEKLLEGVKLQQFWMGFNFSKMLSGIKMIGKSIDLRVIVSGVEMKNLAGVLNPKQFSNKLGEKIVKNMEKIEGHLGLNSKAGSDKAAPTGGVVKESNNTNIKLEKYVDTKKIKDAINTKKLIDGLNIKVLGLIGGIGIPTLIQIGGNALNVFNKMSKDAPPTDKGPKAGDKGSGAAPTIAPIASAAVAPPTGAKPFFVPPAPAPPSVLPFLG